MQSLYSYFTTKTHSIDVAERAMLRHFNDVVELKLVIISLMLEIVKYAENFYEEGKKKHLPSSSDLAPNTRLITNKIIISIQNDEVLMRKMVGFSAIWLDNDHDIIRKLFNIILKSELYKKYLRSDNMIII